MSVPSVAWSSSVETTPDDQTKLKELSQLVPALRDCRQRQRKIVHCHGVFDLLHVGHIRHFEMAKKLGDILVVTITPDRFVNKGPGRPVFPEQLRAYAVSSLSCVDYVAINEWPTAVETIRLLEPHVYVKGSEYRDADQDRTGGISVEEEVVREVGGILAFTDEITFSSSTLLNRHMSGLPKEVDKYLTGFREKYKDADILRYLDAVGQLNVLALGESIIDEYQYCETIGKAGKEPILASRFLSSERFAGGILAIANHLAEFSQHVGMLTSLGTINSEEEFILSCTRPHIEKTFIYAKNAPTIVKKRFVERYPFQKLFEIYVMNEAEDYASYQFELCQKLEASLPGRELVVCADYGHGLLGPEAIELLCSKARFLAINTQVNADNRGFNTVSKYRRADYICVSESEIRLDARSRKRDLKDIIREACDKLDCGRAVITRGEAGCLCYSAEDGFCEAPAFSNHVVDRVGAGDAVLSVTAMCAALGAPIDIIAFLASIAGAAAVATVANRKAVERVSVVRTVQCLLK